MLDLRPFFYALTGNIDFLESLFGIFISYWERICEESCDRAGLLVCEDLEVATRALTKLTVGAELADKVTLENLLNQSKLINANYFDRLGELLQTHPYITKRINNLLIFSKSKEYLDAISRTYQKQELKVVQKKKCPNCGRIFNNQYEMCLSCAVKLLEVNNFCRNCGKIVEEKFNFCPDCGNEIWEIVREEHQKNC